MTQIDSVAIVGANLAGARVAESLRSRGFGGKVTLIGTESYLPYERPPLSKQVLMDGDVMVERLLIRTSDQWDDIGVEVRTAETIGRIDSSDRSLWTAAGEGLRDLDAVVLCTGGRSRLLHVEGAELAGIQYLRDLDDAASLAVLLQYGGRVVVVGGGFIGLEIAASAASLDCSVTVLETMPDVLTRVLPQRWSALIADEHRRQGVQIRTGTTVRRFIGEGRVRAVELDNGERLDADVVVIGIGMEAAAELAASAAVEIRGGIIVDHGGRTSNPHVYAAGDVTVQPDRSGGGHRRIESFQNAQEQADCVAAAIIGQPIPSRPAPWFWSDQYQMNIQIAGDLGPPAEVAIRGSVEDMSFIAFHLVDDIVIGAFGMNRGRDVRAAMRIIDSRVKVHQSALTDPSTDLRKVALRS